MVKKESGLVLKEAISSINKELAELNKERETLKRQLGGIDAGVENSQRLEKELQAKIAKMIEKEAGLVKKKKDTQEKVDQISDKLGKMKKIKSEMTDL